MLALLLAVTLHAVVPDLPGPGPGDEGFAVAWTDNDAGPWAVTDGETTWDLPDVGPGIHWFTGNATSWEAHGGPPALEWPVGALRLANDADHIALLDPDGRTVDRFAWGAGGDVKARSAGLVYLLHEGLGGVTPRMHRVGETAIPPVTFDDVPMRLFAGPDDVAGILIETINGAQERVAAHVYDLRHPTIAHALAERAEAGVQVDVLVTHAPVGHGPDRKAERDDSLQRVVAAGGSAWVAGNDRFAHHHLKVLVADEAVVVMSENWNQNGAPLDGGPGNRGWGVVARDRSLANWMASWMADDRSAWDTMPWIEAGDGPARLPVWDVRPMISSGAVPSEWFVGSIRPIIAPDHTADPAMDPILQAILTAKDRVWTQQLAFSARESNRLGWDHPDRFLSALSGLASGGVDVRVQADSIHPVAAARLGASGAHVAGFEAPWATRLHNKGWLIDDAVIVGSLNANHASRSQNREVSFLITDENGTAAAWAQEMLADDFRSASPPVPGAAGIALQAESDGEGGEGGGVISWLSPAVFTVATAAGWAWFSRR